METLIQLLDFIRPYGNFGLTIIFIILIACGFGFPLPEDIPLTIAGILSGQGVVEFWTTNIVCFLGVLIGDTIIFSFGYRYGEKIKSMWPFRKILTPRREGQIKQWFEKYGYKTIFFGRFMPGLRMPIFMSSGIFKLSPWKFVAIDGFAALISVPLWIWLGDTFGSNLEVLEQKISQMGTRIYLVIAAILIVVVGAVYLKKRLKDKFN
jgi:membrane protein DedA with SNARE-associated domain